MSIKLEDWLLWIQGTDKDGNVRKFRMVKPHIPNPISDKEGTTIELGQEEKE
jgi:hypothetical protein